MDYREEMKQLRDTLNAHGYRYYVLDDPTISDYEYELKEIAPEELSAFILEKDFNAINVFALCHKCSRFIEVNLQ